MVDLGYAKLFDSLSSLFNRPHYRFESFGRRYIRSMAVLGMLNDLVKGVPNPYYQEKKEVGQVEIPEDIFSLSSVPGLRVQVWYSDSSSHNSNREHAFTLEISGYIEVPRIDLLYGVVSGIQKVVVYGFHINKDNLIEDKYVCTLPTGFSIASFVDVLVNGSLTKFVLEYGSLSKVQRDSIIKYGLC